MENHKHIPARIQNYSLAFQQMCSIVAIGQTNSQDDILRELILQTLVLLPDEKISGEKYFGEVLRELFGLQIAEHEIRFVIERLLSENALGVSGTGNYQLAEPVAKAIKAEIDDAIELENKVRDGWSAELLDRYPNLPFVESWAALRKYLAGAFLRHGIQAVALLDSTFEMNHIQSQSLTDLLNDASSEFPDELKMDIKRAISDFVATTGRFPERSKYIAQLANGAFSYFSLATDPKVADRLRQNLNELTLFLDTNFLFGILNLDSSPQVAVSNELIRTIQKYQFPFSLCRHIKTDDELIATISRYEEVFSRRHWSKNISRAAIASRKLSGVEINYHRAYLETGMDVHTFFSPYRHSDVLLNEREIKTYPDESADELSQQRISEMSKEYEEFLRVRGRDKPSKTITHDMTVLDVVRRLRSTASSTLDAGALMITCDFSLYAFDWETSKHHGCKPCTVLPNLFWQIVHPFIPADDNFYQAFAQTFAIPEFRTISSGAADACSKMASIMAAYKDFPEDTALRMLSNDVLIDQLRKAQDDEEFQNFVEVAIVNENAHLVEENEELGKKYVIEKSKIDEIGNRLKVITELVKQSEDDARTEREKRITAEQIASEEKEKRTAAEANTKKEKEDKQRTEDKYRFIVSIGKAIICGIILIAAFEFSIFNVPWNWLITHTDSYGLQASVDIMLMAISFIVFVRQWRKSIAIFLLLPIVAIVLQLLGGPK